MKKKEIIIPVAIVAAALLISIGIVATAFHIKSSGSTESETVTTTETEIPRESAEAETTLAATQETVAAPEAQAVLPEYYQTYAKLLKQFQSGDGAYFMYGGIHEYDFYEMRAPKFALKDINGDGREELIIGDTEDDNVRHVYNLLVPADTWSDAMCGYFSYYDPVGHTVVGESGTETDWTYSILDGDELKLVDTYTMDFNESAAGSWTDYYHGNELITGEEFKNQPALQWPEFTADWHLVTDQNIDTILLGKRMGSENSVLKVLALDKNDTGIVLTYEIGDIVKNQALDCNIVDFYFSTFDYWIYGVDYLEGDLTGDGIDEIVINVYVPNTLVETGCVTYIYTLNGDTLVKMPCVLGDYFENSVELMGDAIRIENGNLYVSGVFEVCGASWTENRCLTYVNGNWTEQYRQKFPDAKVPYDDRNFNDGAEIMATVKNDCEMQPERMQTIYPMLYSAYQNNELENLVNEYYF